MTEKYSKASVSEIDMGFAKFKGLMIPDGRYEIATKDKLGSQSTKLEVE